MQLLHLDHGKTELLDQVVFLVLIDGLFELMLISFQIPNHLTSERDSQFIEMTKVFTWKLVVVLDLLSGHLVFDAQLQKGV